MSQAAHTFGVKQCGLHGSYAAYHPMCPRCQTYGQTYNGSPLPAPDLWSALDEIQVNAAGKWKDTLIVLRAHMMQVARNGDGHVTVDSAHDYLDEHNICVGQERRWLGALFPDETWEHAGYVKSRRRRAMVTRWKLRA